MFLARSASKSGTTAAAPAREDERGLRRAWATGPEARALLDLYAFQPRLARTEYALRLKICPFEEVARHVPARGRVLELGCGYGLLSNLLALEGPARQVEGFDINPD